MSRKLTLVLACLALAACRPDEGQFEQQYTRQICKLYKSCSSWFEEEYDDVDACIADLDAELFGDLGSCTYSDKDGKTCLAAVRAADCERFEDGAWSLSCQDVYACD